MRLNPAETLNEPLVTRRILIVLAGAILFFFVHHALHVSPSLVALSAAAVALVWVRPNLYELFKHIEWSVLIFFAAPIVWVEGNLAINGVQGQGVLLVNGDLDVQGGFEFFGPVLVKGRLSTQGTGGHFNGGVIAANVDLEQNTVLGNAVISYSSCALAKALTNSAPAAPLRSRSWANLY